MQTMTHLIAEYGLFVMMFIIFLEYASFPVSSEIILPFSGAIASANHIPFLLMLPLSVIAELAGTSVCYFLGRCGDSAVLEKITTRFPKTEKSIQSSREKFDHFGNPTILFGRMIPIFRTYIAFIAEAVNQSYKKFLTFSSIGIAIWNTILIEIGYFMKENCGTF